MILLIDNYDSFTFNLVHYLGELGAECDVRRNDSLSRCSRKQSCCRRAPARRTRPGSAAR